MIQRPMRTRRQIQLIHNILTYVGGSNCGFRALLLRDIYNMRYVSPCLRLQFLRSLTVYTRVLSFDARFQPIFVFAFSDEMMTCFNTRNALSRVPLV